MTVPFPLPTQDGASAVTPTRNWEPDRLAKIASAVPKPLPINPMHFMGYTWEDNLVALKRAVLSLQRGTGHFQQ